MKVNNSLYKKKTKGQQLEIIMKWPWPARNKRNYAIGDTGSKK